MTRANRVALPPGATPATAAYDICGDCGTPTPGHHCPACGQRSGVDRSLHALAHEMAHSLTHLDTKGWRSFIALVIRPGELTRRYIEGQRTRHLSPVTSFVGTAFLMFLAFGLIGVATNRTRHAALDQIAECPASDIGQSEANGNREPLFVNRYRPAIAALVHKAPPALRAGLCNALQSPELFVYRVQQKSYKLGFLLVPLSLPVLWLMFLSRPGTRLYDHAVFSLYSISFMSLLALAASLLWAAGVVAWPPYALLLGVLPPAHMFLQLKQSYRLSIIGSLWRTMALAGSAVVTLAIFALVMLMFGLLG